MLYHLHELNSLAATPLRMAAEAQNYILTHPMNPLSYTMGGRAMAATCELIDSSLKPYQKPEFNLPATNVDGKSVAVIEEVVLSKPFCDLLHFKRDVSAKQAKASPRLLIVAPMSGHFATLLRGTVEAMLPDHDVYITDWCDARLVPLSEGDFDLDDYVDYVIDCLRHLGPNTHVLAVCQPSVPVAVATALMAANKDNCAPASLTLMGGPIDTRINPTQVNEYAKQHDMHWFEQNVVNRVPMNYPGFMRKVYPGFLQLTGFMAMNLDRHISAHINHFNNLVRGMDEDADSHRSFYEEYRAVMDMPAEYYLQTVERVFQNHDLPRGEFHYRGKKINAAAVTDTALMTVEGEKDDISAVGQTHAAHALFSGLSDDKREHYVQEEVGHYGVFSGRRWRQFIAPRVKDFIARNNRAGN